MEKAKDIFARYDRAPLVDVDEITRRGGEA